MSQFAKSFKTIEHTCRNQNWPTKQILTFPRKLVTLINNFLRGYRKGMLSLTRLIVVSQSPTEPTGRPASHYSKSRTNVKNHTPNSQSCVYKRTNPPCSVSTVYAEQRSNVCVPGWIKILLSYFVSQNKVGEQWYGFDLRDGFTVVVTRTAVRNHRWCSPMLLEPTHLRG